MQALRNGFGKTKYLWPKPCISVKKSTKYVQKSDLKFSYQHLRSLSQNPEPIKFKFLDIYILRNPLNIYKYLTLNTSYYSILSCGHCRNPQTSNSISVSDGNIEILTSHTCQPVSNSFIWRKGRTWWFGISCQEIFTSTYYLSYI